MVIKYLNLYQRGQEWNIPLLTKPSKAWKFCRKKHDHRRIQSVQAPTRHRKLHLRELKKADQTKKKIKYVPAPTDMGVCIHTHC